MTTVNCGTTHYQGCACHEAVWQEKLESQAKEIAEQCRLNGMGSEREARLMARVEELSREVAGLRGRLAAAGLE